MVHTTRCAVYGRAWCAEELLLAQAQGLRIRSVFDATRWVSEDEFKSMTKEIRAETMVCSRWQDKAMLHEKFRKRENGFRGADQALMTNRAAAIKQLRKALLELRELGAY